VYREKSIGDILFGTCVVVRVSIRAPLHEDGESVLQLQELLKCRKPARRRHRPRDDFARVIRAKRRTRVILFRRYLLQEALEVLRTTPSTVELVVCRLPGDSNVTPPGAPPPPPARREPSSLRLLNPLPPLQIEPCGVSAPPEG